MLQYISNLAVYTLSFVKGFPTFVENYVHFEAFYVANDTLQYCMKKLLRLVILIFLGFACIPIDGIAQLRGGTYSAAEASKSAKFYYVYDGVPGFVDRDDDGEVKGILVEIMREFELYLKQEEGISVTTEFIQVPNKDFKIFMSEVKRGSGGVFGLSNVSIKEERKVDYNFSPPYMNNVSVLISNAKTPTLVDLKQISTRFAGKKAYSVSSSTYYQRLNEIRETYFPSLEIISKPSVNAVIQEVVNNNEAFAVVDLHYYLQLKDNPIKRHPVGDKGEDEFGIIMPKGNDWAPLLTDFFDSGFIGSSEYRKLVGEYLGKGALRLINGIN